MKRRHPKQIANHTEFRVGEEYVLVQTSFCEDSPRQAFVSSERVVFVAALANGRLVDAVMSVKLHPWATGRRLSTHIVHGSIVIGFWQWDDALDGSYAFTDFLGDCTGDWLQDIGISHQFFVPSAAWDADSRVHVIDWLNPDDVCETLSSTWADEEAKLRRRRDAAMRRTLGFE